MSVTVRGFYRTGLAGMAAAVDLRRALTSLLALATALAIGGCTTVLVRSPVPEGLIDRARPYGIDAPLSRAWGDNLSDEDIDFVVATRAAALRSSVEERISAGETPEIISLALSGGGADGAFGAGLLAGWTARGDRPEFTTASGVSTGAIVAVYAFLGPEYDDTPREIYTTYRTQDVFVPSYFAALTGGTALLDASGYRNLIERYIDDEAVRRIADEYRRGSVLLIGTTNIDVSRPVTWDLGAIAASGHPDARQLIHDVIQASSAIPAAFPPVLIPVEAGGRHYDEMHVDGGATQQVMLFSPELRATDIDRALGTRIERTAWVVMNNKLEKPYDPVRPRLAAFAGRSASSLIGGSGSGDIYRLYAVAERDRIKLNVISIPRGFDEDYSEMFDPVYTRSLYDLGHETALSGKGWRPYPPDFAPAGSGGAGAAKLRTGTAAFGANGK